jgi:uncharacterized membrane protein YeaQ/YmgE (transglycosylase-associated protein family)
MNVISWLIIGALVGWALSAAMRVATRVATHEQIYLNAALGSALAAVSGWFVSPIVGVPVISQGIFSLGAALVALVGAVLGVLVVNTLERVSECTA